MDKRFEVGTFCITEECIPIMLKAFANGTRFSATTSDWEGEDTGEVFQGRHHLEQSSNVNHIRVTNDERRRLIPVLKKLYSKISSRSQK